MPTSICNLTQILAEVGIEIDSATDAQKAIAAMSHVATESLVKKILAYDPVQQVREEYFPTGSICHQRSELILNHLPLRQIFGVWQDVDNPFNIDRNNLAATATTLTYNTDFWAECDEYDHNSQQGICHTACLVKKGASQISGKGEWDNLPGTILVRYKSGYTTLEFLGGGSPATQRASIIHQATVLACAATYRNFESLKGSQTSSGAVLPVGTITSEKYMDYAYTIDAGSAMAYNGFKVTMPGRARGMLQQVANFGAHAAGF